MNEITDEVLKELVRAWFGGLPDGKECAAMRAVLDKHGIRKVPTLTPLRPASHTSFQAAYRWIEDNRHALEALIEANPDPAMKPINYASDDPEGHRQMLADAAHDAQHPANCACEGCEPGMADSISLTVEYMLVVVQGLQKREREMLRRLDALEAQVKHLDNLNGMIIARHEERLDAPEARNLPEKPESSTSECTHCYGRKCFPMGDGSKRLCPCVKPGDVVGEDVANLLPLDSQFEFLFDRGIWTREEKGWANKDHSGHVPEWFIAGKGYRILRIGPAPATPPDICEEWAKEIWADIESGLHHDWRPVIAKGVAAALRRLGLPEMQAVCKMADDYMNGDKALGDLAETLDALDAKRKETNGKA